jgi:hypothetical protein
MKSLVDRLSMACSSLELQIDPGFQLELVGGGSIQTVARIPSLGAPNGMLVVRFYADVRAHRAELADRGFGYSVLSEPSPNQQFNLDSYRRMFMDWGWSGDANQPPDWMVRA